MSVTVAGAVASLAAMGMPRDLSAGEILPLVMAEWYWNYSRFYLAAKAW